MKPGCDRYCWLLQHVLTGTAGVSHDLPPTLGHFQWVAVCHLPRSRHPLSFDVLTAYVVVREDSQCLMALQELRPVELGWEDIRESARGEQQRLMLGKVWEVAQSVQELKLTGKKLKEVWEMMQFVHGQKPMLEDEWPPLRHPHGQWSSRPDSGIGSRYEEAMTNYGTM